MYNLFLIRINAYALRLNALAHFSKGNGILATKHPLILKKKPNIK